MIIEDYQVDYSATHRRETSHHRQESLVSWADSPGKIKEMNRSLAGMAEHLENARPSGHQVVAMGLEDLPINRGAAALPSVSVNLSPKAAKAVESGVLTDGAKNFEELQLVLVAKLLEKLTGYKVDLDAVFGDGAAPADPAIEGQRILDAITRSAGAEWELPAFGWGARYDFEETIHDEEHMTFDAKALVKTADGREISVSLSVGVSRVFFSETRLTMIAGDAILEDPLVVNFARPAAELTTRHFEFDLNGDGTRQRLPGLASGSGFLALDRNGNGIVDNGHELFGAKTGDGFAELAKLDDDGNGWLDERDKAFQDLKVWVPDANGGSKLIGLAELGIGAIHLRPATSQFEHRSIEDNSLLGATRASAIFLRENGAAGTVQQVDLANLSS